MASHEIRARLIALRDELDTLAAASEQSSEIVELDQSRVGRLSRMDALQAQAMAQATVERRKIMLRKISAALTRIDNGNYGVCQSCDEPIPKRRLEFDPTASLCVQCAEKKEQ